jgi:hypothetical protein
MMINLAALGFEQCADGKYRRTQTHDFINVAIDEYGHLWVSSELENEPIEIPITMFKKDELDKFIIWAILTFKITTPNEGMQE